MEKELIKDHMVSPAISIADDASLAEAHKIMSEKVFYVRPFLMATY